MELLLMLHAIFGLLGTLAGVWIFAEALNADEKNSRRLFFVGLSSAVLMWLSFVSGGYWYVTFYPTDREVILAGPRPWAHSFFMEAKEHLFLALLLMSTYLPILLKNGRLLTDRTTRNLALIISGSVVLLGIFMERFGSIISHGVTMGLRQ